MRIPKESTNLTAMAPTGYDIIGDIHGHGDELLALLDKLGYVNDGDSYSSPENRQALFLGDFIDRGPQQRVVLNTVMAMTRTGSARAVMGNHEFNAIQFHTADPENPGCWLRPRNDKNIGQHFSFLSEYLSHPKELADVISWFRQLPLWIEIPHGPRLVHACWHEEEMCKIKHRCDSNAVPSEELLLESSRKGTAAYQAIEILLKELEVSVPESFLDKDGNRRNEVRTKWWLNDPSDLNEIALPAGILNTSSTIKLDKGSVPGYRPSHCPVFVGHYWWKGNPEPLEDNVACLDYSVAKGGALVAYRWSYSGKLIADNFVVIPSIPR
ncbi:MAG: metallophosphoesterase [Halioglobus sp.]